MPKEINVLSIAAHDPTAGAGVLSDIKTCMQFGVNGMGVTTGITFQDEDTMYGAEWLSTETIVNQLEKILNRYSISIVKIGMIGSLESLVAVLQKIDSLNQKPFVIWDPVLASSSGFTVFEKIEPQTLFSILQSIDCLTPNSLEFNELLTVLKIADNQLPCRWLVLKGGHFEGDTVVDRLFEENREQLRVEAQRLNKSIHGSGCIFSAALAANMAKGTGIHESFSMAHQYIQQLMLTTESRLAPQHLVQ